MTYEQKYNQNKTTIKNLMGFLQEVTVYDQRLQIITEMGKLLEQQKAIDKMSYRKAKEDTHDYTIEVKSIFPENEKQSQKSKPGRKRNELVS